jgi:hypothetical protein
MQEKLQLQPTQGIESKQVFQSQQKALSLSFIEYLLCHSSYGHMLSTHMQFKAFKKCNFIETLTGVKFTQCVMFQRKAHYILHNWQAVLFNASG